MPAKIILFLSSPEVNIEKTIDNTISNDSFYMDSLPILWFKNESKG